MGLIYLIVISNYFLPGIIIAQQLRELLQGKKFHSTKSAYRLLCA